MGGDAAAALERERSAESAEGPVVAVVVLIGFESVCCVAFGREWVGMKIMVDRWSGMGRTSEDEELWDGLNEIWGKGGRQVRMDKRVMIRGKRIFHQMRKGYEHAPTLKSPAEASVFANKKS